MPDVDFGILKALIAGNVQLEQLVVNHSNIDLVDSICQIKSLTFLKIHSIDDDSLSCLTENLENLTEIRTRWSNVTTKGIRLALQRSATLTNALFCFNSADKTISYSDINAIDEARTSRSIHLKIIILDDGHIRKVSISITQSESSSMNQ